MTRQLILDLQAPPAASFSNFITGRNAAALDALQHLQPGRALYLWGPSGAGRTHLLQAAVHQAHAHYLNADTPADHFAGVTGTPPPHCLIAIDDVHKLDTAQQARVFTLYNLWRETASGPHAFRLALAGDHAPMAMDLREDLRTRLGWDLVFRLEQLSDDDRAAAMAQQAQLRGLRIGPEVINWILTHYSRDMSQLGALIDALDRYSLARHRAITLPLLRELLASDPPAATPTD